ncbi:hypothetical protein [Alteromonas gilva]|uniref:Sulfurtransferase TusA family protein n=1 Tax=Alteromonas gilva TaxID=2987522 RepID=A0ABT5L7E2_9ALTE|nr:hypothetical protein [Alteromonas gilva]MDC8832984.1 hypothetical protein [Alteromonas gilva]
MSTSIAQFDARQLKCPAFSLPVRRFLNELPNGKLAHIVTEEPRAHARMKHICSVYGWKLKNHVEGDLHHFIVDKHSAESVQNV